MQEKDRAIIRASLLSAWRKLYNAQYGPNIDEDTETLYNTANGLGADIDGILDAIQRHLIDATLRSKDGRRRGEFPPQPSDITAHLRASREELLRYDKAEATEQRKKEHNKIPLKTNLAQAMSRFYQIGLKKGRHERGEGPPLTEAEATDYQKGADWLEAKDRPVLEVAPKVKAYWAAEKLRSDPLVQKRNLLEVSSP